jgi:hypothetical protein
MLNIANEHAILKLSSEKDLKNLAHLKGVYLGRNHVAFRLHQYDIDFREYLEDMRDVRYIGKIL